MAIPSIRWLRRIVVGFAILGLLWAASFWWRRLSLPWDSQTALASAGPAVAVVWAIWWLWWWLPKRMMEPLRLQIRDPKARADTEDNFRKTVGQALGGAAVLIGAVAAYLQFTQQQQTAYQQILTQQKAAEDSRKASQDLLISNQVSKGFEQLAAKETALRLGGIYALEGVMNAPGSQYGVPVLEGLCAFVRDSTKAPTGQGDNTPTTDVQAALTVIGRRTAGGTSVAAVAMEIRIGSPTPAAMRGRVDLTGANIPGADLTDAHLERAGLVGAHLERAFLRGVHLEGAYLQDAHLEGAYLRYAHLDAAYFFRAHLDRADLAEAHLEGAVLGLAQLDGANLIAAHLDRAFLRGAHLEGAHLEGADLREAEELTQAQIDAAKGDAETRLPEGLTRPAHWTTPADGGAAPANPQ